MNFLRFFLLAGLLFSMAGFITQSDQRALIIINHTGESLHSIIAQKNVIDALNDTTVPEGTSLYPYKDIEGMYYLRIESFKDNSKFIFFGIDQDGIKGYMAKSFSFRWNNSVRPLTLTVCDAARYVDCK
jgi:hypothetical protein